MRAGLERDVDGGTSRRVARRGECGGLRMGSAATLREPIEARPIRRRDHDGTDPGTGVTVRRARQPASMARCIHEIDLGRGRGRRRRRSSIGAGGHGIDVRASTGRDNLRS
jgi:hypothetical protein